MYESRKSFGYLGSRPEMRQNKTKQNKKTVPSHDETKTEKLHNLVQGWAPAKSIRVAAAYTTFLIRCVGCWPFR